jgi:ABC-2 type transport system ATP-binding protein
MVALSLHHITKRFGDIVAVDDLSFEVADGTVTGFLGPNGAGKSTTLRILLGLVRPTAGRALVTGVPYQALSQPLRTVGAALESSGFHPRRRAVDHLRVVALAADIPPARVEQVLDDVGLTAAAGRRVGGFSLGMRQRLALATALLGDPQILVADEPTNGLDPQGVHWVRGFLRHLADEGRTVLVSSHHIAELALTADHAVIIRDGRLIAQGPVADLTGGGQRVRLRTPQTDRLAAALTAAGIGVTRTGADEVIADGSTEAVGRAVAGAGIAIYEMRAERLSLEDVFLTMTTQGDPS